MRKVYPVVLTPTKSGYVVSVPDLEIDTQGIDISEAIYMARDAISLCLVCELDDFGREIPEPSELSEIKCQDGDIVTLVDVDIDAYRRILDNRSVRKNLTIPNWMNVQAEKQGINFSAVLQEALSGKLANV
ncbi:MAG: type II toxin-antitoxin system HicB family antitoxin [Oscillospiraceae bacterium]|nr:type II toxin-antitoxin system HicB family antitoxin [Oscillospiraceae bacterium]